MKLKTLSIFTSILFVISIFVYLNENKRGTDLLSGSDYVKGLDVNKIQKISLSFLDDKKITLTRDSNRFVIENHKSYPADTGKINELIYKIASIQVKEKITSNADDSDLEKYELNPSKRKYLVELFDDEGKKTVSFSVGKSNKGKGNYLYREGKKDIYLSKENLWLNSSYKDFINTVLLNVPKDDVQKVTLKTDEELQIVKKENSFIIPGETKKKIKQEKAKDYLQGLSNLRFEDFLTVTEPKAQGLKFSKDVEIELKNKLVYKISMAEEGDDYFVRLAALLNEAPKQFVVKKDDGKEELQKIEDVLKAQAEAQKLNMEKGAWVYKVNKSVYEKLAKETKFFL
tara:strand:+ start:259 stop:1287 length:1029 start_codon:yes stop_codon:yes gene_type:complete